MKLWIQKWEESERDWGTRPDGYTVHLRREDIAAFFKAMREREMEGKPEGYVPREYSQPDGSPYEWETTDQDLISKVRATTNGCWGTGEPPAPALGVYPGGWVRMDEVRRCGRAGCLEPATGAPESMTIDDQDFEITVCEPCRALLRALDKVADRREVGPWEEPKRN